MNNKKIIGTLGISAKAGKVSSGEFATEQAVKKGKAYLVLVAGDASENTRKKFFNICEYYQVPFFVFSDRASLGNAVGKEFRASLAVTDVNLAKLIEKQFVE